MNIDNKKYKYPVKGFLSNIAPYATASSGAALGFLAGGPMGAITGGKLGYELGRGNADKFAQDLSGEIMHALPFNNKRKRE